MEAYTVQSKCIKLHLLWLAWFMKRVWAVIWLIYLYLSSLLHWYRSAVTKPRKIWVQLTRKAKPQQNITNREQCVYCRNKILVAMENFEKCTVAMLGGPCSQHVTGNTSRQNQPQSAIIPGIHCTMAICCKVIKRDNEFSWQWILLFHRYY